MALNDEGDGVGEVSVVILTDTSLCLSPLRVNSQQQRKRLRQQPQQQTLEWQLHTHARNL